MRFTLLCPLALALLAGTAHAQDFRTARADRAAETRESDEPDQRRAEPAPPAAASPYRTGSEDEARYHARQARRMVHEFHSEPEEGDAPRQHQPLTVSDGVVRSEPGRRGPDGAQ